MYSDKIQPCNMKNTSGLKKIDELKKSQEWSPQSKLQNCVQQQQLNMATAATVDRYIWGIIQQTSIDWSFPYHVTLALPVSNHKLVALCNMC